MSSKSSKSSSSRPYSLLVVGATGYTGTLVSHYIAQKYGKNYTFAIVGRSKEKLEKIATDLKNKYDCKVDSVAFSNLNDESEINKIISQGSVVINTMGPFLKLGEPIVKACVTVGTDYVDITGEAPWISKMIEKYHDLAVKNNVLIVNCTGFDSLPADLGTYLAVKTLREQNNTAAKHVHSYVKLKGAASGGTLHTIMNLLEDKELVKSSGHNFLLNPEPSKTELRKLRRKEDKQQVFPKYQNQVHSWSVPFVMTGINSRVVRRSAALFNESKSEKYGKDFSYNESQLVKNVFLAFVMWIGLAIFGILAYIPFTRNNIIKRVIPAPGEGPTEKQLLSGKFSYDVYAQGENGSISHVLFKGQNDPGYAETSKMTTEAALTLLECKNQLQCKGGVVPPAFAMGQQLIDRINKNIPTLSIKSV